ncbi:DMT family transporter [Gemella sp. Musashino-2025]
MITSLFGVVLMATHLDFNTLSISAIGLFWGIFSAVGLASYNISSIRLTTKYGATIITAWGLFIAGTIVYFATGSYYIPAGFSLIDFLCITGIVLIGTIASFTMYLEGIKLIGAVTGSIIGCFEPIAAIIFSFLLLGTTFSSLDLLGAAFILSAVVVLSKR